MPMKSDEDIVNDAYADNLKALFNIFYSRALKEPDAARDTFTHGVSVLRSMRDTAVQSLPKGSPTAAQFQLHVDALKTASKRSSKKRKS